MTYVVLQGGMSQLRTVCDVCYIALRHSVVVKRCYVVVSSTVELTIHGPSDCFAFTYFLIYWLFSSYSGPELGPKSLRPQTATQ